MVIKETYCTVSNAALGLSLSSAQFVLLEEDFNLVYHLCTHLYLARMNTTKPNVVLLSQHVCGSVALPTPHDLFPGIVYRHIRSKRGVPYDDVAKLLSEEDVQW